MKKIFFTVLLGFGLIGSSFSSEGWGQEGGGAIQSSLRGTWRSVCMDLGDGQFIQVTMTFEGAGSSHDKTVFFKDPGCSSPTGLVKVNPSVSYRIGDALTIAGKQAHAIDTTIQSWQLIQDGSVIKNGGAVPTQYDVIAVEGDKLYTSGLSRAQKTMITNPAQRPSTLDTNNFYTRVGSP